MKGSDPVNLVSDVWLARSGKAVTCVVADLPVRLPPAKLKRTTPLQCLHGLSGEWCRDLYVIGLPEISRGEVTFSAALLGYSVSATCRPVLTAGAGTI